ncbi:hypothetical protein B9Z19DRAFT_1131422 [Tuber borchii]|uniref:Uncharacterized protein n=1 Tax=Tuber borchii TaxID=42251 RepID=A0A2T6ZJ15_TUBBO|nr:hypothetical protein B9Z19DRAFT_1131422 [Tuber borchii]
MPTSSSRSAARRILKDWTMNIGILSELYQAHDIKYCDMMEEILCFIKQTAADDPRLPADPRELSLLSVPDPLHQKKVLRTFKEVLNAPGPPRGVLVPVVHMVHTDPL